MANIGYIQVNRYCNNKCHFCSNPSNGSDISFEEGIRLIDNLKNKSYDGIIFTGGEPTLSKDLPSWIKYANDIGINCRVISNGNRCADYEYAKTLKDSGLNLIHLSIYSHSEKIHDFLTNTPGSYKKLLSAIMNCLKLGIEVQINTVINHYNQDHLDKIVLLLIKKFPHIRHFVWNNLDPLMMRQTKIAISTLPDFDIFEKSLIKAMSILEKSARTFRVERVPLCFLKGFEYASTETRKIVKSEERLVYFLDERIFINDKGADFMHDKLELCKKCDLNAICAGVYEHEKFYNYINVKPQNLTDEEKKQIIDKINNK